MKSKVLATLVLIAVLLLGGAAPARVAAADPIQTAIEKGIGWLVNQQKADGSWGDFEPVAHTGFAVVKLEERAFELGYASPFDDAYPYKNNVISGLNYLFSQAATYGAGTGSASHKAVTRPTAPVSR